MISAAAIFNLHLHYSKLLSKYTKQLPRNTPNKNSSAMSRGINIFTPQYIRGIENWSMLDTEELTFHVTWQFHSHKQEYDVVANSE